MATYDKARYVIHRLSGSISACHNRLSEYTLRDIWFSYQIQYEYQFSFQGFLPGALVCGWVGLVGWFWFEAWHCGSGCLAQSLPPRPLPLDKSLCQLCGLVVVQCHQSWGWVMPATISACCVVQVDSTWPIFSKTSLQCTGRVSIGCAGCLICWISPRGKHGCHAAAEYD